MTAQENKKGFWKRLTDRFQHPPEKDTIEMTLGDQGIKVAKDTRLSDRFASIYDLHNLMMAPIETTDPEQYLKELKNRLDTMDLAINLIASPYARAGDYPQYRRMMRGWSSWYAIASSWIQRTSDYWFNPESNPIDYGPMDLGAYVRMLHDDIQKHVFKDAFSVLNFCFRDKDVSVHAVTVIQSMQMPMMGGGGETLTSSNGRTSEDHMQHPDYSPVGKRLANKP